MDPCSACRDLVKEVKILKTIIMTIILTCMIIVTACSGGNKQVRSEPTCQQECESSREKCKSETKQDPVQPGERTEIPGPAEVSKKEWEDKIEVKLEVTEKCEAEYQKCVDSCK